MTKSDALMDEIARLMSDNQHWTAVAIARALDVPNERVKRASEIARRTSNLSQSTYRAIAFERLSDH
ncbi:hypothetical protein BDI4_580012 [Burkholderia diffusa]|nr:hypothetical protein BDI4_580012 [Burkholderia diffusa]